MADKDRENYRPRRAFVQPEPADEPAPASPTFEKPASSTPVERPGGASPDAAKPAAGAEPTAEPAAGAEPSATDQRQAEPTESSAAGASPDPGSIGNRRPTGLNALIDEDEPKPLFRDEVGPDGVRKPVTPSRPVDEPTAVRPITFAPKRNTFFDDEETTVLPRSRATGRSTSRATRDSSIDDDHDEDERPPRIGARARLALMIGVVAAITVIGLAIAYAVLNVSNQQADPAVTPTAGGSVSPSASGSATPGTSGLLTAEMMLTPEQARQLSSTRTWTVDQTVNGPTADAPVAACFGGEPVEGGPVAQQQIAQLLSSSGKNPFGALHLAWAYASAEEATQAFVVASKTLGGCPVGGSYIAAGQSVTGVGDQSVGVIVNTVSGTETQVHSVVLTQTGRVVDIVDATRSGKPLPADRVADAAAAVVATQCAAAGGTDCGGSASVKPGPPPLGGDEPGYLATGDLPPAGGGTTQWTADAIEKPDEDFLGSNCEVVNWETLNAEKKTARTYLFTDSGDAFFGVNEIILTMEDEATANKQAQKIADYVDDCKKRKLTATIDGPTKVSGPGAADSQITGSTFTVTQKSVKGDQKYRVGIVSTGTQVIYTFSNPKGDFDFTDAQWQTIALRAGERATQVN